MKDRAKRPNEEISTQILLQLAKVKRDIDRAAANEDEKAEDIAHKDALLLKDALFLLEMLQRVHRRLLPLVNNSQEPEFTPTERSFIHFCCDFYSHEKYMDGASIEKLRAIADNAKEKKAKKENAEHEATLRHLMHYFNDQMKTSSRFSQVDTTLTKDVYTYLLYTRLKERENLKTVYSAEHLETLEIAKRQTDAFNNHQKFQNQKRLANLLMTAISSNLSLWNKKCSKFGSYSKINGVQVPGSIAVAFDQLKTAISTYDQATLTRTLESISATANARLTLTQRCRYKLFSLRHDDVTKFLSLLANAKPENIDHIKSDLTKMGLTASKEIKRQYEIQEYPVKKLTNGCFIRI